MPASVETNTYNPDNLISGDAPILSEPETVLSGQNLARGAVVGRVGSGAASIVATGGNTGDGVPGAVTKGDATKVGDYVLTCIVAAVNGGTFSVIDPDGDRLADLVVAVAYVGDHINLTIADGAADFIVGDEFTVTIAAGSGKWVLSLKAAVDGSEIARGVMVEATDASLADLVAPIYKTGQFDPTKLTYGAGHDATTVAEDFEGTGLFLRQPVIQ